MLVPQERQVDSEYDDLLGVGHPIEARGHGRHRSSTWVGFDREANARHRGLSHGTDDDELVTMRRGGAEHAVEHGDAPDLDQGLVDAPEATGPSAGQHQCRSHARRLAP